MISNARTAAVCAWLRANSIDPNDVPIDATIIEDQDAQIIRYKAFLRVDGASVDEAQHHAGSTGRILFDSGDFATEWRETPLLQPAPEHFPA